MDRLPHNPSSTASSYMPLPGNEDTPDNAAGISKVLGKKNIPENTRCYHEGSGAGDKCYSAESHIEYRTFKGMPVQVVREPADGPYIGRGMDDSLIAPGTDAREYAKKYVDETLKDGMLFDLIGITGGKEVQESLSHTFMLCYHSQLISPSLQNKYAGDVIEDFTKAYSEATGILREAGIPKTQTKDLLLSQIFSDDDYGGVLFAGEDGTIDEKQDGSWDLKSELTEDYNNLSEGFKNIAYQIIQAKQ